MIGQDKTMLKLENAKVIVYGKVWKVWVNNWGVRITMNVLISKEQKVEHAIWKTIDFNVFQKTMSHLVDAAKKIPTKKYIKITGLLLHYDIKSNKNPQYLFSTWEFPKIIGGQDILKEEAEKRNKALWNKTP